LKEHAQLTKTITVDGVLVKLSSCDGERWFRPAGITRREKECARQLKELVKSWRETHFARQ